MDTEFAQFVENVVTMHMMSPETEALKNKLKESWSAGDYDYFSRYMENDARAFYDRIHVPAGSLLLDVACGSGQLALWAARDGAKVTGVDIVPSMIKRARARANAEDLNARFLEADAEDLPFEDATFDVVTSLIGAMFAPRPDRVASELARVCRRRGKIAMANWSPEGFVGQMFKMISRFIAPSGMPSPTLWGNEDVVRDRLGAFVTDMVMTRRDYIFSYPFAAGEVVDFFRQYYGPVNRAFASLNQKDGQLLHNELTQLWSTYNRGSRDFTVVKAEYLEVMAIRN